MITVVALGCEKNQLTLAGAQALKNADKVFVKTALTDTYEYFQDMRIPAVCLDFIYENSENFDDLDEGIVDYLLSNDDGKNNVYCVNGSGYDDRSVIALARRTDIKIIPSVSMGINKGRASTAAITISAYDLVAMDGFNYDTRMTLAITDVDNEYIASDVKLALQNILGDEEEVYFNGAPIPVYKLDRQSGYGYSTVIFVPAKELAEKKRFGFADLYLIMKILRGDNGCQWDKAQTHATIRQNVIEEAYELADAIDNEDIDNMIEESGDIMLQSVFHGVIGEDTGEFNVEDILSGICRKLIDRHTHIFGDVIANTEEEALDAWDKAKAKEKNYTDASGKMDRIAKALPALMRAHKVQKAAAKEGFEFDEFSQVKAKIEEEIEEFIGAKSAEEYEDEGGDVLFAAVNALRWKKVDPEIALSKAIDKFVARFKYVEKKCGGNMKDKDLQALWEEAKVATKD